MARAGDALENPPMGGRIVFRKTAQETNGELLQFDFFLKPHGVIAREHVHPQQEERFEVVSGKVRGRMGGKGRSAGSGEVVVTPPGLPHVWWNDDEEEEAHLLVEFRPALDSETFLETVCGLARDGKTNKEGIPSPLQMAVLLDAHKDEFYPAVMPIPVLKALVAALAPIGRLLGYRAHYPQYTRAERGLPEA